MSVNINTAVIHGRPVARRGGGDVGYPSPTQWQVQFFFFFLLVRFLDETVPLLTDLGSCPPPPPTWLATGLGQPTHFIFRSATPANIFYLDCVHCLNWSTFSKSKIAPPPVSSGWWPSGRGPSSSSVGVSRKPK